eukprot:scaffold59620_cov50-Phaeocystis_antarctica.AAC.1
MQSSDAYYSRGLKAMQTSQSGSCVNWVAVPTAGWPGGSARAKTCSTRPTHTRLSSMDRSLPGQRRSPWPKGITTSGGGERTEPSGSSQRRASNLPGSGPTPRCSASAACPMYPVSRTNTREGSGAKVRPASVMASSFWNMIKGAGPCTRRHS